MTGEFPAQRASNAENDSIRWRHNASVGHASLKKVYVTRSMQKNMTIFSLNMNDNFDIMIVTLHILNKGNKLIDAKHDIVYCLHKKYSYVVCHFKWIYVTALNNINYQMHGITHIIFHVCG